jgi:hypothetical protein
MLRPIGATPHYVPPKHRAVSGPRGVTGDCALQAPLRFSMGCKSVEYFSTEFLILRLTSFKRGFADRVWVYIYNAHRGGNAVV